MEFNEDLRKAKEALEKANVPCVNMNFYFTGTEEEYKEFCEKLALKA